MDPYIYVFVRTDIPLADQLCQVAHACVEAGKRFCHPEHTNLVLLKVPDKAKLLEIEEKCRRNKVDSFTNYEPDDEMHQTALATGPVMGSTRRIFSGIPLWS